MIIALIGDYKLHKNKDYYKLFAVSAQQDWVAAVKLNFNSSYCSKLDYVQICEQFLQAKLGKSGARFHIHRFAMPKSCE